MIELYLFATAFSEFFLFLDFALQVDYTSRYRHAGGSGVASASSACIRFLFDNGAEMQKPSIYAQARDTIRERCRDIIEYYFSSPGAKWENGEYWTHCPYRADNTIGSFSINGKNGAWCDFAGDIEQDRGDLIDLIGLSRGLGKKSREAAEIIVRDFGTATTQSGARTETQTEPDELTITTPPDEMRQPIFPSEPDYITEYVPGFVIARWDKPDGKVIRPYTFTPAGWVSKRPSGWLPLAPFDPGLTVVVVEGEKCYHAAQAAGINATTWHGGAQSIKRADLSPLAGSVVVIWPDNDEPGMQAADYISEKLKSSASEIRRVVPEPEWPAKYDIADEPDPARVIANARVIWPVEQAATIPEPIEATDGFTGYTNLEKRVDPERADAIVELIRERANKPKGDISGFASIRHILDLDYDFKWLVRYDEAKRSIVFSDEYKTIDDVYIAILNRCADYGVSITPQTRRDIVDTIVKRPENRFNSILDLLNILESQYTENDIEALLDEWIGRFVLPDNSYEYHKEIWRLWFTKTCAHLHGAFTKYDQIPADIVPVLVGGQGIGKSTLCRALSINPNEYFVDMGDKAGKELGTAESMRLIAGKIIAELGEMISIRKSEIETVKSFISATADHMRQLYREGISEIPRTASFIGTSNPDQFLVDVTGNRRFFPLKITAIDPWLTASDEGAKLIKKLYAAFSRIGRELVKQGKLAVMAACKPSAGLESWLAGARDMATDAPVVVEKIIDATSAMESEFILSGGFTSGPGRRQEYMKFTAVRIAGYIFGSGNESKADRNFGRWCDKVLLDMGYERSTIKVGPCTQRGWKKHMDKIKMDNEKHEHEILQQQITEAREHEHA